MYHSSYVDIAEGSATLARANEWRAIDRAVALLEMARPTGAASRETIEAATFNRDLWGILIDDLASTENNLPETLRAALISIGFFALRQGDKLRLGQSEDFDSLIEVNTMIRDSLA
ncbi:flagellar biosynthesis regulator FlaF [Bosea caraganae]|uniref:Flagellar biosynthesis regulator FlaF n=1 Tax=Bosea caraganae TaxID=2763117 RepID=A0A370LC36_9HYPH|nr:flagellar biosynthesis regulator FlaF [Bosea caraganae]RDJ27432.1 flagellar biosynthesis regulator FlaF [Bosea caraganae]RDJ29448.1 flagellar biosynthesis regulator FlaF [Bosea caraganae]